MRFKKGEKTTLSIPINVKKVDKDNYRLTMVASTQDKDRHGDTVIQDGWDLKPFKKNPVILNSHNYFDATEVIARAENVRVEGKGKRSKLLMDWVFAVDENPKAKIIFDLYAGKFLHASSVGFIPRQFAEKENGERDWFTIDKAELLEVSAVSVPANAAALVAKGIGASVKDIEEAIGVDENADEDVDVEVDDDTPDEDDEPVVCDTCSNEADDNAIVVESKTYCPDCAAAKIKSIDEAESEEQDDEETDVDTDEDEQEEHVEPQKTVSKNRKVLNAIKGIESERDLQYKKSLQGVQALIKMDKGASYGNLKVGEREKVRKRKINQTIRALNKAKYL